MLSLRKVYWKQIDARNVFELSLYTTCLTGTVKEKNLTGTPILGYILPGTQVNFYWDKIFSKNNWLGQKIGSKVDWDTILSRKIECDNNLSEIFGWDKMLYEIRLGRNFAWKVTRTISVENYQDILAHLRVTGIIFSKKYNRDRRKTWLGSFGPPKCHWDKIFPHFFQWDSKKVSKFPLGQRMWHMRPFLWDRVF